MNKDLIFTIRNNVSPHRGCIEWKFYAPNVILQFMEPRRGDRLIVFDEQRLRDGMMGNGSAVGGLTPEGIGNRNAVGTGLCCGENLTCKPGIPEVRSESWPGIEPYGLTGTHGCVVEGDDGL